MKSKNGKNLLEDLQAQQEDLQALKDALPSFETYQRLRNEELPVLEKSLGQLTKQKDSFLQNLELVRVILISKCALLRHSLKS